jgi:hypothetical protein
MALYHQGPSLFNAGHFSEGTIHKQWEHCRRTGEDCEVSIQVQRTTSASNQYGPYGPWWTVHDIMFLDDYWPGGVMNALALPPQNTYDVIYDGVVTDLSVISEMRVAKEQPWGATGGAIELYISGGCAVLAGSCDTPTFVDPPFNDWPYDYR